jgi:hypothetical protein
VFGAFIGFLVGYVVGTRSGREGAREVVDAAAALRESEEFKGLVDALREHARHGAYAVGDWLSGEGEAPNIEDLLRQARERLGRPSS